MGDVPRTCKGMLRQLRRFMEEAPQGEAEDLWDVLTALRGPDRGHDSLRLKGAVTAVIRREVFGHELEPLFGGTILSNYDDHDKAFLRRRRDADDRSGSHFLAHARDAFLVLGLDWRDGPGDVE